jgi:hypothetical protein
MLRKESYELYLTGKKDPPSVLNRVTTDPKFFVAMLDKANVEKALLISIVSPDIEGMPFEYNDFLSEYAKDFPDRLIPIGSIHPRLTSDARKDFEHVIDELEMRGIKIHPSHQLVYPNEYRQGNGALGTIYAMAQDRKLPVIIHTGTSVFPKARNIYADPIYVDDVAVDYPDLNIVLAHGGRPLWTQTALFLIRRHKNVYMDISGIPPEILLHYFPKLEEISEKVMFGSDWAGPFVPGIKENIASFLKLPISSKAKTSILRRTALKLFQ